MEDYISYNYYMNAIYNKPTFFLARIRYYFKKIRPIYKKLKNNPLSFDNMCEFSDFIKLLEMVFFYNNDTRNIEPDTIRIVSDNNINNRKNKFKNLTILDTVNKVTMIFNMSLNDENKQVIDLECKNKFGKQLSTKFVIIDKKVVNFELDSNTYNLLYNINHTLNKCVSDLFIEYYKKA